MLQRPFTKLSISSVFAISTSSSASSNTSLNVSHVFKSYFSSFSSLFESSKNIDHLHQLHAYMITSGQYQNIYLVPKLISQYAEHGSMDDASHVFDKSSERNLCTWTAIINGYVRNGFYEEALIHYQKMRADGIMADKFIFSSVAKACAELSAIEEGIEVHEDLISSGFESDIVVGTSLVSMYAKCGEMDFARELFDKMPYRNSVSWSAIIAGYVQGGDSDGALKLFKEMQIEGIKPDLVIMVSVLPAFAHFATSPLAGCTHGYVIRSGFEYDFAVSSALIDMYAKCGCLGFAKLIFDRLSQGSVGSWNAMIVGYTQNGYAGEALKLFNEMRFQCIEPDLITVISAIPACAYLSDIQLGKLIHGYIVSRGFHSDVRVGTALLDMYAKCGKMDSLWLLFCKMDIKNVISWNATIAGYAQNGYDNEAFRLFIEMQLQGLKPDAVTMVNTLSAIAHLSALQQGKGIHGYIIQKNLESDVVVCNALLDMYAKCGTIEFARQVFDSMFKKTVVSWNAMISGYGMHGRGKDALSLFTKMQQEGVKRNHITFISILCACSHSGLLDDGRQCFENMIEDNGITPSMEHYACMVDLFGRAGLLDEAHVLIQQMPFKPNAIVWGSLLGACRVHSNILLGEHVMKHILELVPENVGHYVQLSNIYAEAGRWDDADKLRNSMKVRGLKKTPGCSWIEVNNRVQSFSVTEGEGECYG